MIVNISDSPLTGFKRKAELLNMTWDCQALSISIKVLITYHDNEGNLIRGEGINEYERTLIANNNTQVDITTGAAFYPEDLEEGEEPPVTMGEYDFYMYLIDNGPVNIKQLIAMAIDSADNSPRQRLN
jgi:hypothetical protein